VGHDPALIFENAKQIKSRRWKPIHVPLEDGADWVDFGGVFPQLVLPIQTRAGRLSLPTAGEFNERSWPWPRRLVPPPGSDIGRWLPDVDAIAQLFVRLHAVNQRVANVVGYAAADTNDSVSHRR
jgi:hypothetical protein